MVIRFFKFARHFYTAHFLLRGDWSQMAVMKQKEIPQ